VIRITFTEPIRPGTATPASISLEGPDGIVTTILEVSDGDRVVTLRPLSPLRDETQYTVRVLPEILDRLGKTMVNEYVASFKTEDITAPRWLEIPPAPNTGGVTVYSPIRIPFSEPIAPAAFSMTRSNCAMRLTQSSPAASTRFSATPFSCSRRTSRSPRTRAIASVWARPWISQATGKPRALITR
jgi:hypothetical protein